MSIYKSPFFKGDARRTEGLNGFTLIELMVVIAIGIILVGVGVTTTSKYLARESLNSAKEEIKSTLQTARNYAITAQKPDIFVQQLDCVAVTLSADGKLAVWPVNLLSGTGASYSNKDISSDDVSLAPTINYKDLIFSVPEGKLLTSDEKTPVDANYVMTISVSSTEGIADTMSVSVDAGGKIW
jgi:type IV fimbrial biogenesis protein FimT